MMPSSLRCRHEGHRRCGIGAESDYSSGRRSHHPNNAPRPAILNPNYIAEESDPPHSRSMVEVGYRSRMVHFMLNLKNKKNPFLRYRSSGLDMIKGRFPRKETKKISLGSLFFFLSVGSLFLVPHTAIKGSFRKETKKSSYASPIRLPPHRTGTGFVTYSRDASHLAHRERSAGGPPHERTAPLRSYPQPAPQSACDPRKETTRPGPTCMGTDIHGPGSRGTDPTTQRPRRYK